jgi:hypothetical protein
VCLLTDNISAVTKIVGKEVTLEDGKQYMRTEKLLVDFTLGKSRFRIRDYINDGNILGKPKCETCILPPYFLPAETYLIATDCTSECIQMVFVALLTSPLNSCLIIGGSVIPTGNAADCSSEGVRFEPRPGQRLSSQTFRGFL